MLPRCAHTLVSPHIPITHYNTSYNHDENNLYYDDQNHNHKCTAHTHITHMSDTLRHAPTHIR